MRSNLDNYFLDLLNDFPDAVSGDVESPTGYFALVSIPADEVPAEHRDLVGRDGRANLVIIQDNYGFITGIPHDLHSDAVELFTEMEEEYLNWLDADESEV